VGETEKIPALPSGEHPWARPLRRWRKIFSAAELAASLGLTAWLALGPAFRLSLAILPHSPTWLRALAYAAALALIYGVALFPFSFFGGHWLDRRFGLSTQSIAAWLVDALKGAAVGAVIGAVALLGLFLALTRTGANWWWVTAIGGTVLGIALTRIAPQFILPLFFKLKPLEQPDLQRRFTELGRRVGAPVLGVFEIDMSRRTRAANAAVIGFGKSRMAVVGDTLLQGFSEDEVEFVLAHELGHHRYHDLWTGIALSGVVLFVALFLANSALRAVASAFELSFPFSGPGAFEPYLLFWLAIVTSFAQAIFGPITRAASRAVEARADRFAASATGNPKAGASAFRKLGYTNLAVFKPPRWEEALFYTHPCLSRRIDILSKN
jgi:STE24 endopeptidase